MIKFPGTFSMNVLAVPSFMFFFFLSFRQTRSLTDQSYQNGICLHRLNNDSPAILWTFAPDTIFVSCLNSPRVFTANAFPVRMIFDNISPKAHYKIFLVLFEPLPITFSWASRGVSFHPGFRLYVTR